MLLFIPQLDMCLCICFFPLCVYKKYTERERIIYTKVGRGMNGCAMEFQVQIPAILFICSNFDK